MSELLILALFFASLFIAQTIIYTVLLFRLRERIQSKRVPASSPQISLQPLSPDRLPESTYKALRLLSGSPLTAREVSRELGLSREHTARLLKKMVEEGLVTREGKPYRYRVTSLGLEILKEEDRKKD